jgi:hypothetical protein
VPDDASKANLIRQQRASTVITRCGCSRNRKTAHQPPSVAATSRAERSVKGQRGAAAWGLDLMIEPPWSTSQKGTLWLYKNFGNVTPSTLPPCKVAVTVLANWAASARRAAAAVWFRGSSGLGSYLDRKQHATSSNKSSEATMVHDYISQEGQHGMRDLRVTSA